METRKRFHEPGFYAKIPALPATERVKRPKTQVIGEYAIERVIAKRLKAGKAKIGHFVNIDILLNLYYSLLYPFLTYGLVAWRNTYSSNSDHPFILQKMRPRFVSFSAYREYTTPLFIKYQIIKFHDLFYYHNAIFVYNFHSGNLLKTFDDYFESKNRVIEQGLLLEHYFIYRKQGLIFTSHDWKMLYRDTKILLYKA